MHIVTKAKSLLNTWIVFIFKIIKKITEFARIEKSGFYLAIILEISHSSEFIYLFFKHTLGRESIYDCCVICGDKI